MRDDDNDVVPASNDPKKKNDDASTAGLAAAKTTPTSAGVFDGVTTSGSSKDDVDDDSLRFDLGGLFRGIAAATRKLLPTIKPVAVKSALRTVGQNRPLAFASEGAVAADTMLPRVIYYGAWTLSSVAIMADVYTKYDEAKSHGDGKTALPTALYWTCFHIPASLVVPAMIIHRVVHGVQHSVEHGKYAQSWSPRTKSMAPVVAALLAIVPVVPAVDHTAEAIMEPTLGRYLGLEFHHHGHHGTGEKKDKTE
jgi:hypothetical protein